MDLQSAEDFYNRNLNHSRFGPRQIRSESAMLRHVNLMTGASPFDSLMVADIGDMSLIPFNVEKTCQTIREETAKIIKDGCRPLFMGGDHLVTYPILQAMKVYSYITLW